MSRPKQNFNRRPGATVRVGAPPPPAYTAARTDGVAQHAIDIALAQAALRKVHARCKARAIAEREGEERNPFLTKDWQWWRSLRDICRDLSMQPWRTMSANARRGCERTIGADAFARIVELHMRDAVHALDAMPRPLKPPTRSGMGRT